MIVTRRGALALGATIALGACAPAATPTPPVKAKTDEWTVILPSSDVAVGQNRFLYAVLDERNRPILDAKVHLRFYDLDSGSQAPVTEADPVFRGQGLGNKGVYVARVDFPKAGAWGVESVVERPDNTSRTMRTKFEVRQQSMTPAVGAPAPKSVQKLMKDVPDPRQVCTASPPCSFHDITVADAVASGKPSLLLFATPAFCTSAVCGPDLENVQAIEPDFRGKINVVHLEIYDDPNTQTPTPTVKEWRLPSEPWIFLVDREGRIADKLEGGLTQPEIREGVERLL